MSELVKLAQAITTSLKQEWFNYYKKRIYEFPLNVHFDCELWIAALKKQAPQAQKQGDRFCVGFCWFEWLESHFGRNHIVGQLIGSSSVETECFRWLNTTTTIWFDESIGSIGHVTRRI